VLTGGVLGSLLAGGISVYAQATHGPYGWFRAGHGPWGHHHHAAHSPEAASAHAEFATDWVLSRIKASDEQRQQVKSIVQAAVHDLWQVREQHHTNHQAWLEALGRPTIDRAVLGQLRQTELQLADTASSRLVDAIAEVAEVLTPEQRTMLLELATRLRH
jgi:Spy/CpxP family protein refolding chaperone